MEIEQYDAWVDPSGYINAAGNYRDDINDLTFSLVDKGDFSREKRGEDYLVSCTLEGDVLSVVLTNGYGTTRWMVKPSEEKPAEQGASYDRKIFEHHDVDGVETLEELDEQKNPDEVVRSLSSLKFALENCAIITP